VQEIAVCIEFAIPIMEEMREQVWAVWEGKEETSKITVATTQYP